MSRTKVAGTDVTRLRQKIGKLLGKGVASRGVVAKLVGASPGSIFNWEHGTAPTGLYREKLKEIEARLDNGTLDLGAARRKGGGVSAPLPAAVEAAWAPVVSDLAPVYANDVRIDASAGDIHLQLAVQLAGAPARVVANVVVPRVVLDKVRAWPH